MAATVKYKHLQNMFRDKIKGFENYLGKKGYRYNTIVQITNYTVFYLSWLNNTGGTENGATYNEILMYIGYCRENGDSTRLINRKLPAIRHYYGYLGLSSPTIKNPASGLYLKGENRGIPSNLLEKEGLFGLYNSYVVYDLRTARNKIIIGLLVYQALTSGELEKLEPCHINLKTGTIEIPGGRHSNGRSLQLQAPQIIELYEYMADIRPAILEGIKNGTGQYGRKAHRPDIETLETRLIPSLNGSTRLKRSLRYLIKGLQEINPKVTSSRQIRQSVISLWLKSEDVRKVQYKAGHKYVSTTERYQSGNLEDLQEALKMHHPLGE